MKKRIPGTTKLSSSKKKFAAEILRHKDTNGEVSSLRARVDRSLNYASKKTGTLGKR